MSPEPCMSFYSKCAESPALNHVPVHCAEQRGIVGNEEWCSNTSTGKLSGSSACEG